MTEINGPDDEIYAQLVREQEAHFPSITLAPEYAELFEINTLQILIKLARYKFACRMLKRTDSILEVGSGTGLGGMFLSQHCHDVTGLEIKPNDHAASIAVNRRDNVKFLHQSLYDYPSEAKHDVVVSIDVLEHMSMEDGRRFIAKMVSHLKPSGMMILGTPSIHSYPYQSKYSRAAHVKCYDQPELVGLMDDFFIRTLPFSMNDEIVHTGHPKMAWYYFVIGMMPKE